MITSDILKPPQIPHAKKLIDSIFMNGFALDTSETGCGKTYVACHVVKQINVPVFVICPKIVIPSWKAALKKFGVKPIAIKNYEALIRGNKNSRYTSWVREENPLKLDANGKPEVAEVIRFNKRVPQNALIIFDEVHKCKAYNSTTSDLLITAASQGFKLLKLSASAATNVTELKALGYATKLHRYTTANDFKRHFAVGMGAHWTGKFGTIMVDPESKEAREGMAAIHKYLFKQVKCASRLTKKQMSKYFGKSHIIADALDMKNNTAKINNVYDIMEYELAQLEEHTQNYSAHAFAIMMKARRHAELLKIPTFVENVMDALREGSSVAMFLNFNESIEAAAKLIEKKLSTKSAIQEFGNIRVSFIRGGQKDTIRQQNIDDFNNDISRVMISNISAGGVGVNLHDVTGKHPRHALISPNFSAIQLLQALGRVDRVGAITESVQKIIFAAETIEERACKRVQARLNNLSMLNDGDMTNGIKFYGHVDFDVIYNEQKVA